MQVMDFMEHDVKQLMAAMRSPFTEAEVKRLMLDLTSALAYCHDRWVFHRDLKTSNLLMNNRGEVAICDFGLARYYHEPLKRYSPTVVTLWYRAPEVRLLDRSPRRHASPWHAFAQHGVMPPLACMCSTRRPRCCLQVLLADGGGGEKTSYGPAIDVWSLGCIFAELVLKAPLMTSLIAC